MFFNKSKSIIYLIFLFWGCTNPEPDIFVEPETSPSISVTDSLLSTADSNLTQIRKTNQQRNSYLDSLSSTLTHEEYLIRQLKQQLREKSLQIDTLTIKNTTLSSQLNLKVEFISTLKDSISSHTTQIKNLKNKIKVLQKEYQQYQTDILLCKDSLSSFKDSLYSIPKYKKRIKKNEKI